NVHLQKRQHKRLFAALIALEQLRLKLPVAVLGHHQLQLPHPRLQRARLQTVAPAAPNIVALVALGAKKAGHLSLQNLLHGALYQLAEKVLPAETILPSRYNPNTLFLASHLSPPCECRSGKQHPKESTRWLADDRHSAASTELYGLNRGVQIQEKRWECLLGEVVGIAY